MPGGGCYCWTELIDLFTPFFLIPVGRHVIKRERNFTVRRFLLPIFFITAQSYAPCFRNFSSNGADGFSLCKKVMATCSFSYVLWDFFSFWMLAGESEKTKTTKSNISLSYHVQVSQVGASRVAFCIKWKHLITALFFFFTQLFIFIFILVRVKVIYTLNGKPEHCLNSDHFF